MESLAMAFPVIAKLFATYVQNIASEELAIPSDQKLWPNP